VRRRVKQNLRPEVGSSQSSVANGNATTFIALSATPAPPAPVVHRRKGIWPPASPFHPKAKQPGVLGGSPNGMPGANGSAGGGPDSSGGEPQRATAARKNDIDVSISGGHPPANNGISVVGGSPKISAPVPHVLITRPDPHTKIDDAPERTGRRISRPSRPARSRSRSSPRKEFTRCS